MPAHYRNRRNTYYGRGGRGRGRGRGRYAYRNRRNVGRIRGAVKEMKFRDVSVVNRDIPHLWSDEQLDPTPQNQISGVPLGTGESERIGRKYTIYSIHIHGVTTMLAENNTTEMPEDRIFRFVLVLDKQSNQALLSGNDVFATSSPLAHL